MPATTARRVAIGLGVAAALGAAAWWAAMRFLPEATIDLEPADLQGRLDERFPQRSCALMLACVTVAATKLALVEGSDRIGLAADVQVALGHRQADGHVAVSGLLRYVRYRGEFYLDDLRVEQLDLQGAPPDLVAFVRARAPGALQRALEGRPVYTIEGHGPRAALARLAVRDVRVVDGRLRVTFVRFGAG